MTARGGGATSSTAVADPLCHDRPLELTALPRVPRLRDGRVDVLAIARRLHGSLLESSPAAPGTGRHSYVVASTAGRLVHRGGGTTLTLATGAEVSVPSDPFAAVDEVAGRLGCQPFDVAGADVPLTTGLVGLLGYDLADHVEALPRRIPPDRRMPELDLVLADAVVAVDHATERARLVRRPLVHGVTPRDVVQVTALLDRPARPAARRPVPRPVTTSLDRDAYRRLVRRVLDHIAAGDVFQVNVGQRLTAPWDDDLASLYRALRDASPAPFGAMHTCADGTGLASISPETFLVVDGRRVRARPMKGTRPRGETRQSDEALRNDLLTSAKDRAENVMIVDLLRNDLGRVCVPGTVEVPALFTAEAHPTVWQLVSTITGRLQRGTTIAEVLRATFPCGSVTGAPKVRAMQLIEELEPVRRGPWCGAFGFLAPGAASLSVTIRTAALADGVVDYAAGGGIVADSDPDTEVEESWAKAAAFLEAVDGVEEAGE